MRTTLKSQTQTLGHNQFTGFLKSDRKEEQVEGERKSLGMFYSQWLLSKNSPLAAIWVAGCCFKRLKKRQVTDTHIPSSVDKILLEGLPSVTYRILAYLLLGVVRIYSRKVEYLYQDCHETVSDINRHGVGKKVVPFKDLVRSASSIILPERYELDAFRLEFAEGAFGGNVKRKEDIILQDATAREDTFEPHSFDKNPFDEVCPDWEENFDAQTSAWIAVQPETCSVTLTPEKVAADKETSASACTPPDKVFSPQRMEIEIEERPSDRKKNIQTSKEKLRELRFTQEECMDDIICGLDVELLNLINEYQVEKVDDGDRNYLEKAELQNHDHVVLADKEVPFPMEKPLNIDVPDDTGGTNIEFLAVSTPAKRESIKRLKKRKCIVDETLLLNNQTMKQTINDASDLVCKRRKAPHTVIDIWRFSLIPYLSKNFSQPLIPCAAATLEQLHVQCVKRTERAEASSSAAAGLTETTEAPVKHQGAISPRTPADSRSTTIAPGTPVRAPTSARVFGDPRTVDSDGEGPVHMHENMRKELSIHEEQDRDPNLMDEVEANEGDSQELHKSKEGLSARTRTVARYLHQVIHKKRQQGEKAVTLLPIFERKTKAENARLFFELLVLTSGGFMTVKQERAYDDVLLQETSKMETTLASC